MLHWLFMFKFRWPLSFLLPRMESPHDMANTHLTHFSSHHLMHVFHFSARQSWLLGILQSRAHSISLPWLMLFPLPGVFFWHFWLCSLHFKNLTSLSKLCESSFFMKFLSKWRWHFPSLEFSDTFLPSWSFSCCTLYCDDLWFHLTLSNKPEVPGQGLFSANLSLSPSD